MDAQLSAVILTARDGARAEINPHGAQVASWVPAGGGRSERERLFLSQASEFQAGAPMRGGAPVIFPQFGGLGALPKHGFARLCAWELVSVDRGAETASTQFALGDSEATRQLWPHSFRAEVRVTVGGQRLEINLVITNTGRDSFTFTAALHTYFRVEDVATAAVEGLQGVRFHDTTVSPWVEGVQMDPHPLVGLR